MRVARLYAVKNAPERPRVADPERRRQIADYLSGGATIGHGPAVLHTDGLWLWPERFVDEILDAGLAPELDLLGRMRALAFRAPVPVVDDRLSGDALRAWRAGPPREPRLLVTYFVRVDGDSTVDSPLSLLRRAVTPAGGVTEEALWRDLAWHPTNAFGSQKIDYDLREIDATQAAAVLDRWCAKWHAEAISRATR